MEVLSRSKFEKLPIRLTRSRWPKLYQQVRDLKYDEVVKITEKEAVEKGYKSLRDCIMCIVQSFRAGRKHPFKLHYRVLSRGEEGYLFKEKKT